MKLFLILLLLLSCGKDKKLTRTEYELDCIRVKGYLSLTCRNTVLTCDYAAWDNQKMICSLIQEVEL